jgi:hypothetical protein
MLRKKRHQHKTESVVQQKLEEVQEEEQLQNTIEKLEVLRIVAAFFLSNGFLYFLFFIIQDDLWLAIIVLGVGVGFLIAYYIALYTIMMSRKMATYNEFVTVTQRDGNLVLRQQLEDQLLKETRCYRWCRCMWCAWVCCLWKGKPPKFPESDSENEGEDEKKAESETLLARKLQN